MKKILLLLLLAGLIVFAGQAYGQSNASNTTTPIPLPVPVPKPKPTDTVPHRPTDTIPHPPDSVKIDCKTPPKLVSFSLPCCVSKTTDVASIAKVTFDNQQCPPPAVTFTPATLSLPYLSSSNQTVTASAGGVTLQAQVNIVNEDVSTGSTQLSTDFKSIGQKFYEAIIDLLENAPCAAKVIPPSANFVYETSLICCPGAAGGNCVTTSRKYSGSASIGYGFTCHFPIYGCPYLASLDAVFSANASASVGINYKSGCTVGRACASIDGNISVGGGLGATLAAGFISAELQLLAGGSLNGSYCFYPKNELRGNITMGSVKVVGTVSGGWGLISHTVEFTVFNGVSKSFPD
ncbi:MAG TPA: hypothetical protein VG738_13575 [Chitinophagaceae bacterium]|nr:hypothetical protein [Chitinophagaceae bacterium]